MVPVMNDTYRTKSRYVYSRCSPRRLGLPATTEVFAYPYLEFLVLYYDIEHLASSRPRMKSILWLNAPILGNFNVKVRKRNPVEVNC